MEKLIHLQVKAASKAAHPADTIGPSNGHFMQHKLARATTFAGRAENLLRTEPIN